MDKEDQWNDLRGRGCHHLQEKMAAARRGGGGEQVTEGGAVHSGVTGNTDKLTETKHAATTSEAPSPFLY